MKGIVIDVKHKDAVILSDDGLFKKIKNKNYEIGQTLQLTESMESTSKPILQGWKTAAKPILQGWKTGSKPILGGWKAGSRLVTGAASIAAVMVIGTIGAFAYYTPTDYVSMDVNPSIEYSVNMFDRILDTKAVNEDGEEILSSLNLKNKNIEEALRETLDQLISEGYLEDDEDSGVVIATSNDELVKAEKLAKELEQDVRTYLVTKEGVAAKVEAKAVAPKKVKEAENLGVSAGKLCLVEKLQASTHSAIDRDKWLTMPVKDINKAIKENREKAGIKPESSSKMLDSPYSDWNQNVLRSWSQGWDQTGFQSWNQDWNQTGFQSWSQGRNQTAVPDWNQKSDNKGKQDWNIIQSPVSNPAIVIPALTQDQNKNQNQPQYQYQYPGWPDKESSGTGIENNDTWNQNWNWNQNGDTTRKRTKKPGQNQGQSKTSSQAIWNWNQNKTQDQIQSPSKAQVWNWEQNQNQNQTWNWNRNQNQKQNKNEDQDQGRNQNKGQSKSKNQSWYPNQGGAWNWDQDQTSNQAIWNGGWYNGWKDSNDDDQNNGNGSKQSGDRKSSRDR